jgi:hypothetical protein
MTDRQHIVVGRAPDLQHARHVLQQLQGHGVDAADIRLAGDAAERADRKTLDTGSRSRLDNRTAEYIARRAVIGAIVGGLVGLVLGVCVGLVVTNGDPADNGVLFTVMVGILTALGSAAAAIGNAYRTMGYDDTWQLTFDDTGGSAWVAVRVRDHDAVRAMRGLLEQEGITDVEEHDTTDGGVNIARW